MWARRVDVDRVLRLNPLDIASQPFGDKAQWDECHPILRPRRLAERQRLPVDLRRGRSERQNYGSSALLRGNDMRCTVEGHARAHRFKDSAQWHKDRQAQFAKLFGHSIKKSTLDEQLAFSVLELKNDPTYRKTYAQMVAAGDDVRLQARIVSRGYERPGRRGDPNFGEEEARARGAIAQNINTTINVNGKSDPKLTAQEVARAQKHVNQQLARNTQGGAW